MKRPLIPTERFQRRSTFQQIVLSIVLVFTVTAASATGQELSREYPLKAAFLYKFGGYVDWPAEAFESDQAPLIVGVVGPNPFGTTLDGMAATKQIRGRPIVVKYSVKPNELSTCHILFISDRLDDAERLAVVHATQSTHVLLVGESVGLAENGAVVNFFIEENKVRFEINIDAARQRQLKISSKLLSLARVVESRQVSRN
jgi:hypothetical protein